MSNATPDSRDRFALHDIRARIAAALATLLLAACPPVSESPRGAGGAAGGSGGALGSGGAGPSGSGGSTCQKPEVQLPIGATCTVPLDGNTSCEPRWERPLTASCRKISASGLDFDFSGPSGAHLVVGSFAGTGGWACFYDPSTKVLLAAYEYSDTARFCCDSYWGQWSGPLLPGHTLPDQALCEGALADAGVPGGAQDAADASDAAVDARD